ncbi:MAG: hypothetical protein KJO07_03350, partial [Deltaproteobacteria bacterium]|nr:hypothetical protein [Deltaproteobacteria bacterium]
MLGCSGPATGGVDAGTSSDGGAASDAGTADCRLEVRFSLNQTVPGSDPDTATLVERVTLELEDFRLISDTTG